MHPHDCPPSCRACAKEEALSVVRDQLECDEPMFTPEGDDAFACGRCARCMDRVGDG